MVHSVAEINNFMRKKWYSFLKPKHNINFSHKSCLLIFKKLLKNVLESKRENCVLASILRWVRKQRNPGQEQQVERKESLPLFIYFLSSLYINKSEVLPEKRWEAGGPCTHSSVGLTTWAHILLGSLLSCESYCHW